MKSLLLFCSCFIMLTGFAQQEQHYTQYAINPFTINPAIAGTEDFIDVQAGYRSQWSGFEGAPKTSYITAHGTIGKPYLQYHHNHEHHNWHGIGFQFNDDKTGPIQRNAFLASYAYNMGIKRQTRISVGSYFGFKQFRTNKDYWQNIDDVSDKIFSEDLNTGLQAELQVGVVLYNPKYFVMMSVQNLLAQQLDFSNEQLGYLEGRYARHVFLGFGRKYTLTQSTHITPTALVKYAPNAPTSVDLGIKADYKNLFWYGAGTRFLESVNVYCGTQLKQKVDISYAFEWSFSKLKKYNVGTHEIIIGLRLKHPKNIICPSKFW